VWLNDEIEMVFLGGTLLFLHQLCQYASKRRRQTNPQLLHAVDIGSSDVLLAKSTAYDTTMGKRYAVNFCTNLMFCTAYLNKLFLSYT